MLKTPAFTLAAGVLLAALITTPAHAQWQWRTADGRVTMSDRPPPRDVPDKDIIKRPAGAGLRANKAAAAPVATALTASAPAASAPTTALDRQVQERKRAAEQEQAAKAKAEEERLAAVRANNCRTARAQTAALDSGIRIARTNDKGEREFLDDRARADEQRRARDVMASDCR